MDKTQRWNIDAMAEMDLLTLYACWRDCRLTDEINWYVLLGHSFLFVAVFVAGD